MQQNILDIAQVRQSQILILNIQLVMYLYNQFVLQIITIILFFAHELI
jgi:hypothetical protein